MNSDPNVVKQSGAVPDYAEAWDELESSVHAALETYSNVHRGSGHNSMVSTHLFEQARDLVLEYLGLNLTGTWSSLARPEGQKSSRRASRRKATRSCPAGTLACRWVSGRWPSNAGRCPEALPSRPVAGQPGLSFPQGHLGQGTGQVRGRHARHRQRHRLCQGAATDPAVRKGRFPGCDLAPCRPLQSQRALKSWRPPRSCTTTSWRRAPGGNCWTGLRQTLIGRGVRVPTVEGAKPYVNLDNAASTPTFSRSGRPSARHGASPGRSSKRSSERSSPSAPGCWARLWQPTT